LACRAVAHSLAAFQHGEQTDDIAIVALRFVGLQSPPVIEKDARMLATTDT
jgi:hypothetical protein